MEKKGFTLVELIVVIGIIVILATILITALNPNELLKRGRDTRRMNDLAALSRAITMYLADVEVPFIGTCTNAYVSRPGVSSGNLPSGFSIVSSTSRAVDGTGWIPINFTLITGGSPISMLPADPAGAGYYVYGCTNTPSMQFELNARLESSRYRNNASNTNDGGNSEGIYEVGTNLNIFGDYNLSW